jgi:hypothetical protein
MGYVKEREQLRREAKWSSTGKLLWRGGEIPCQEGGPGCEGYVHSIDEYPWCPTCATGKAEEDSE